MPTAEPELVFLEVRRTGGSRGNLSCSFRPIDRSAERGCDFSLNAGVLYFGDGECMKEIPLLIHKQKNPRESGFSVLIDSASTPDALPEYCRLDVILERPPSTHLEIIRRAVAMVCGGWISVIAENLSRSPRRRSSSGSSSRSSMLPKMPGMPGFVTKFTAWLSTPKQKKIPEPAEKKSLFSGKFVGTSGLRRWARNVKRSMGFYRGRPRFSVLKYTCHALTVFWKFTVSVTVPPPRSFGGIVTLFLGKKTP